jgi:hypothetical protein
MTHGTPEDIAEMLLQQREDFVNVASSRVIMTLWPISVTAIVKDGLEAPMI